MEEQKQVEWIEEPFYRTKEGDMYPGDRRTYPKARADAYIEQGLARCVESGYCGERTPGAHKIQPDAVKNWLG